VIVCKAHSFTAPLSGESGRVRATKRKGHVTGYVVCAKQRLKILLLLELCCHNVGSIPDLNTILVPLLIMS